MMRKPPSTTKNNEKPEHPDGCDAEDWITDEIFLWNGKRYRLTPNFKIVSIPEKNPPAKVG